MMPFSWQERNASISSFVDLTVGLVQQILVPYFEVDVAEYVIRPL